jgi:uncharacterized membrane protein YfcA
LTWQSAPTLAPRLIGLGLAIGAASGFFVIGGGFLITPALMWATDMPLAMAIGSSLVAVSTFGATTAFSYAASGLMDWPLTGSVYARRLDRRACWCATRLAHDRIAPAFCGFRDRGGCLRH